MFLCILTLLGLFLSLVLGAGSAEVFSELAAEEAQSTAAVPQMRLRVHSWAEGVAVSRRKVSSYWVAAISGGSSPCIR